MMPASLTTYTYRVTDSRACAVEQPMGKLIRHLGMDNEFQGRADGEWITRVADDGMVLGYVRASLTEAMPTSFGIASNRRIEPAFTLAHSPPAGYSRRRRKQRIPGIGTYLVIDPEGRRRRVTNLARFCRLHELSAPHMYYVVGGRLKRYQGWKVKRIT